MTSSNNAPVSARERARQANARRLADAQSRLKNQEQDLISYFDATRDQDKVADDLAKRIERLQREAQTKLESTRRRRAQALASLKSRGETYSSIAALVGLPVPETTKLVKSAAASGSRDDAGAGETPSPDERTDSSAVEVEAASTSESPEPAVAGESQRGDADERDIA
ncbi:hypothetical protein HQ346_14430 [Rhodococcus sp. BP-252]|uniref:hypothetical protein n=1 Tax=unclassified Rhodococcus (in: high G+C Gram-positive bacteria) TaxID=192944 RepID=UPI001C9A59A3|nr:MULTISPECIES: hypothetical protein [unclassified Rhodococcus (in: high G+C Gram-positive bacteria)]MBY6412879.1 hypothetical protein [Rhodococcus sp. BP-320]MBY6417584.1 hypothetical protein [Rhodococcus sp. BP-321]MBY6423044.1 hypothetical protein [Rhodococcus sp. BP-324]MBY6427608.1 hypothetical protein [Rhodococcus sp. BP-323]MBY6432772.1 hypothetical protein [Rhodococcus sp. BP-322]